MAQGDGDSEALGSAGAAGAVSTVTYEQLADLETDFDDVDLQLLIHQEHLSRPLYAKRAALVAQIPHFWALVLEQAPPDLDPYIQPSDSRVIAECLAALDVERFEIGKKAEEGGSVISDGSPRSLKFTFEFSPNEWFEDRALEKKFWFRRAGSHNKREGGWTALVSEPVKIHWKKGKDLTDGLTDAAVAYWDAKQKVNSQNSSEDEKQREKKVKELPEYKALLKKVGSSDEGALSFFAWFGFTAGRRFISAEESAAANKAAAERRERRRRRMEEKEKDKESKKKNDLNDSNEMDEDDNEDGGDDDDDDDGEDEASDSAEETEIFPNGEELATLLAEEIWPQAIKYFTEAQELDDEDLSDMDVDMEEDEDEDDNQTSSSSSISTSSSSSMSGRQGREDRGKSKQNRKKKKKEKKKNRIDIRSLVTDQQPKRKARSSTSLASIRDDDDHVEDSASIPSSTKKKKKK